MELSTGTKSALSPLACDAKVGRTHGGSQQPEGFIFVLPSWFFRVPVTSTQFDALLKRSPNISSARVPCAAICNMSRSKPKRHCKPQERFTICDVIFHSSLGVEFDFLRLVKSVTCEVGL